MNMTPVTSSNIKAIGYDPATKTMRVQFNSGATHDYADVPAIRHSELMGCTSKGSYFHSHIRNQHASSKVED